MKVFKRWKHWLGIQHCYRSLKCAPVHELWQGHTLFCPYCGKMLAFKYWLNGTWQIFFCASDLSSEIKGKILCSVLDIPAPYDETKEILDELYEKIYEPVENNEEVDEENERSNNECIACCI